jgi:hypothetical protein
LAELGGEREHLRGDLLELLVLRVHAIELA